MLPLPRWELVSDGERVPLSLPAHFDDRVPNRAGTYSLATEAALPEAMRGRPLVLAIPHFRAHVDLFVGDERIPDLDVERFHGYRGTDHPRFRIPARLTDTPRLSLTLVVDHAWTQSAWLDTVPALSATERGHPAFLRARDFNQTTAYFALATAALIGMLYTVLALRDRGGAYQWFALEAVSAVWYPAQQTGVSQYLVGHYDAPVMLAAVTFAVVASVYFTHAQFGLPRPNRVWAATAVVSAIACAIASGPFDASVYAAPITVVAVCANVAYQLILTTRTWLRTRRGNALALAISWAALGLFGVSDFASWAGLGEWFGGLRGACLGITVIAVLQAIVLGLEHIASQRRADALNIELADRIDALETTNREMAVLYAELRRQVAARAEGLSRALSSLTSAASIDAPELDEGDLVDNRYRVLGRLGAGGMCVVYQVKRVADGARFALKVLGGEVDGVRIARFAREAKVVAEISHPNVVSVVDVDVSSDGYLFFVMELVEGEPLSKHVRSQHSQAWSLSAVRQIAQALDAVHALNVVHRDLKPGNVFVSNASAPVPIVKLGDFGIARVTGSSSATGSDSSESGDIETADLIHPSPTATMTVREVPANEPGTADTRAAGSEHKPDKAEELTRTGMLMGTPKYIAPEVARTGARRHACVRHVQPGRDGLRAAVGHDAVRLARECAAAHGPTSARAAAARIRRPRPPGGHRRPDRSLLAHGAGRAPVCSRARRCAACRRRNYGSSLTRVAVSTSSSRHGASPPWCSSVKSQNKPVRGKSAYWVRRSSRAAPASVTRVACSTQCRQMSPVAITPPRSTAKPSAWLPVFSSL